MPVAEAKPREWGDGATDTRLHVIEDMSYAAGVIVCRCGVTLSGSSVDELSGAWVRHGGTVLRMWNAVERGAEPTVEDSGRSSVALSAILFIGMLCTCTPDSDVRDCANYIPSDEGVFGDDTDE